MNVAIKIFLSFAIIIFFIYCNISNTLTTSAHVSTCLWMLGVHFDFDIFPVNPCVPNPCVNGSCLTTGSGYSCFCNDGYTGTNCDLTVGRFFFFHLPFLFSSLKFRLKIVFCFFYHCSQCSCILFLFFGLLCFLF